MTAIFNRLLFSVTQPPYSFWFHLISLFQLLILTYLIQLIQNFTFKIYILINSYVCGYLMLPRHSSLPLYNAPQSFALIHLPPKVRCVINVWLHMLLTSHML